MKLTINEDEVNDKLENILEYAVEKNITIILEIDFENYDYDDDDYDDDDDKYDEDDDVQNENHIFFLLCSSGRLKILKLWLEHFTQKTVLNYKKGFKIACTSSLDIVKFLIEYTKENNIEDELITVNAFINAIKYGDLNIIQFLSKHNDKFTLKEFDHIFLNSCSRGNLDEIKFIFEYARKNEQEHEISIYNGLKKSCDNGHIEIVKYLVNYAYENHEFLQLERLCIIACEAGHLNILKYLFNDKNLKHDRLCDHKGRNIFTIARMNQNIDIVKFLLSNYSDCDFNHGCSRVFNIDLLKFLYDYAEKHNVKLNFLNEFQSACNRKYDDKVLFLLDKVSDDDIEKELRFACENGNLEITMLLLLNLSKPTDITILLKLASEHENIVKFLSNPHKKTMKKSKPCSKPCKKRVPQFSK